MLAGATNNETNSADLTVLDYLNPGGHAPATLDDYRCMNCPPGDPLASLILARTEVSQVLNFRPYVREIRPDAHGGFQASVFEGIVGVYEATAEYSFDRDLRLQDAQLTDAYPVAFGQLLARNAVKHTLDRKADTARLRHVRYWDGREFHDEWAPALVSEKK
jgi:hypothetical protein